MSVYNRQSRVFTGKWSLVNFPMNVYLILRESVEYTSQNRKCLLCTLHYREFFSCKCNIVNSNYKNELHCIKKTCTIYLSLFLVLTTSKDTQKTVRLNDYSKKFIFFSRCTFFYWNENSISIFSDILVLKF